MMIQKFRKKPVVIEAVLFDSEMAASEIIQWSNHAATHYVDVKGSYLLINTLEGSMVASLGDFVIKGVNGEFYPCKPDIFQKTYEPVNDQP